LFNAKAETNDYPLEINDIFSSELKHDEHEIDTLKRLLLQQQLLKVEENYDDYNYDIKDLLINKKKVENDDNDDDDDDENEEDSFALVKIDKK
jgi:hypothetical protein